MKLTKTKPKALWTRCRGGIKPRTRRAKMVAMPKRRCRVRPVSKAMARRRREYRAAAHDFLHYIHGDREAKALCQLCGERDEKGMLICGVAHAATEVHHKKGRVGALLMDKTFWMGICSMAHFWIHQNVAEAKKRGWILPGWNHSEKR